MVTTIIYGTGAHRRFTQDGPILPDVWAAYLEQPDARIQVLIEPWSKRTPFDVAKRMRARLGAAALMKDRTIYNRTIVSSELTVQELVRQIIPLTGWYTGLAAPKGRRGKREADSPFRLPAVKEMWEDLVREPSPTYPAKQLLPLVRIAGLAAYLAASPRKRGEDRDAKLAEQIGQLRSIGTDEGKDLTRRRIAEMILAGWKAGLGGQLPRPEPDGVIFTVNRNRTSTLAVTDSVKTVKGDAASRLFSIECAKLTWAIVDCGIDATHPAFLDRADAEAKEPRNALERLQRSRVKETYDFTYLMDLLLGDARALPARAKTGNIRADAESLAEIAQRIRRSRAIDWELLRPFLRISHDASYLKSKPVDSHGTHVAGILGANWMRAGDPIIDMCPDIRLIDIRVCRPDGSSNEFIIISALQFLRYLNANAEKAYIQGANISLSIPHDVSTYGCGQTPVCVEADRTVSSGVVVVAAAGNAGYRRILSETSDAVEQYFPVSITDPGNAVSVITVGSTHRIEPHTYGVSYFSSRGPTGDGRSKPDLLAPGEKIRAPALDDETARLDGTSMAAPHVSGAAAMLMARHVELQGKPERIKEILCSTATDLGRERHFQGCGMVDVLRAIQSM